MSQDNKYYQLPDNTDRSIRKMLIGLFVCVSVLIIIVALVLINAQTLATKIPFSAEKRFIRPYAYAIKKWYPSKPYPEVNTYLSTLANQLAEQLDLPEEYELSVHYVDSNIKNAFATLGGHIFIFKGLINSVESENALAMIIAHEIAHIKNRDPVAAMSRGMALMVLYSFLANDYSNSEGLTDISGNVGLSFFSRTQEEKADLQALDALQKHYGHIADYDYFFSSLIDETTENQKMPEWLSTHPDLEKRINYLKTKAEKMGYSASTTKAIPEHIKAIISPKAKNL